MITPNAWFEGLDGGLVLVPEDLWPEFERLGRRRVEDPGDRLYLIGRGACLATLAILKGWGDEKYRTPEELERLALGPAREA